MRLLHAEADVPPAPRDQRQPRRSGGAGRAIAALAAGQHGVVSSDQLRGLGLSGSGIGRQVEAGRLHAVHRGVYAVGHPRLTQRGRLVAAVLACGPGAVVSHRAAAALFELRPSAVVEVTAPTQRRAPRGVRVHVSLELPDDERAVVDGIPVTTVPRTLLDLAAVVPRSHLERAAQEAEVRRLGDVLSLADVVDRHRGRRGAARLRAVLADVPLGRDVPHRELARRFDRFVERAGLPRPETSVHVDVAGRLRECDCVWRAARVMVELDGRQAHDTTRAFEQDRRRDRAMAVAGWRVVRVTWRQLHREPDALATDLRALLTRRG